MKVIHYFVISMLLLIVLLTGCTVVGAGERGSGNIVSQEMDLSDFTKVNASHSFTVNINQGDSYSVIIRTDDNLVDNLDVSVQGDTLRIQFDPNRSPLSGTMEADITMPQLTGIEFSGASDGTISGFSSTNDFRADLSGSSSLTGDLESGDARFDVSGASDVRLGGSGGNLVIDASGSSDLKLFDFAVEDADIQVSGSSTAEVNVNGTMNVNASGASDVTYTGNPSLGNIDTSGSSSVNAQ